MYVCIYISGNYSIMDTYTIHVYVHVHIHVYVHVHVYGGYCGSIIKLYYVYIVTYCLTGC